MNLIKLLIILGMLFGLMGSILLIFAIKVIDPCKEYGGFAVFDENGAIVGGHCQENETMINDPRAITITKINPQVYRLGFIFLIVGFLLELFGTIKKII